jgi:hypothetical protein
VSLIFSLLKPFWRLVWQRTKRAAQIRLISDLTARADANRRHGAMRSYQNFFPAYSQTIRRSRLRRERRAKNEAPDRWSYPA